MAVNSTPLFGTAAPSGSTQSGSTSAADAHFAAAGTAQAAGGEATIPVVADGTDQSGVINAWLADPNYTVLRLPAGEFWLSSNITVPDGKTLIGAGQNQTTLSLLPDYAPVPWVTSAIIVKNGSTLTDLTFDGQKVNLEDFPSNRICGVVGVGQDVLVENVSVKNTTGYAFWANSGNSQTTASGIYRGCYAENANMLFETTYANGVRFENCTGADGDDDIPMDAAFHPTAQSNNISFVDCSYEGNAQAVNLVSVGGAQQNISFTRVTGTSTDGSIAVWIGGDSPNQVSFTDCTFVSTAGNGMNILSGSTVNATNTSFSGYSVGIYVANGTLSLTGSQVIAKTDPALGISTFGIYGGPYTVTGGLVMAIGGGGGTSATRGTGTLSPSTAVVVSEVLYTTENGVQSVNLLSNDVAGTGTPLTVTNIAGQAATPGAVILLPSGAKLTIGQNGAVTYDTNGAHNALAQVGTGAANSWTVDSFSYTLSNGYTATAAFHVSGIASPGDKLLGNAGNNVINGLAGADYFLLDQGGNDTANGHGGDDIFDFGAAFTSADRVDGGAGNDTLLLRGAYSSGVQFQAATMTGVETIQLASKGGGGYFSYNLTLHDGNVAAGQRLAVDGSRLRYGENLMFYGQGELNGAFDIVGGASNDWLYGGQQGDTFIGGLGTDRIWGNGGDDTFSYRSIAELSPDQINGGAGFDTLLLNGSFAAGVTFAAATMTGVERILLGSAGGSGYNGYKLTFNNANVAAGETLAVDGAGLRHGEAMYLYGSGEADGRFAFTGGAGNDYFHGGAGNDWMKGGLGRDYLRGNGGADTFAYDSAAESTGTAFDQLVGFDWREDRIDLPVTVSGWNGSTSGALRAASFNADLAAAVDPLLAGRGALLFTATSGEYAGRAFLVVDGNNDGSYTAGADYVLELVSPAAPLPGTTEFFI